MTDIKQVAEGLSDRQKRDLLAMDAEWRDRRGVDRIGLWKASEKPLLQIDGHYERLTPLGLALRSYLLDSGGCDG